MIYALITVALVCFGLIGLLLYEKYQGVIREDAFRLERVAWGAERRELVDAHAAERQAWAEERRDLNNRIQIPEAAPFMDVPDESGEKQYIPFDDDDAFLTAEEITADG